MVWENSCYYYFCKPFRRFLKREVMKSYNASIAQLRFDGSTRATDLGNYTSNER